MPRILALDLARVAGAAFRDSEGRLVTRAYVLGREGNLGACLVELRRIVETLLEETGADLVSVENDIGRGAGSTTLRAYHAVARMTAEVAGVKCIVRLNAPSARKHALGYGGGDKARVESLARALIPGIRPDATNDEVDAAVLLVGTEQFLLAEERMKAIKRQASAQARKLKRAA